MIKNRIQKDNDGEDKNPSVPYFKCIAKSDLNGNPGISVPEHCRNSAYVSKILAAFHSNREVYKRYCEILAAVHDVGKISPGFQKKYFNSYLKEICPALANKSAEGFETNHALISECAVRDYLHEDYDSSAAGEIVGIHHGKRKDKKPHKYGIFGGGKWADERLKFIGDSEKQFGKLPKDGELDVLNSVLLSGLVCTSDWIASDEEFFPPSGLPDDSNLEEIAGKAVLSCGFVKPKIKAGLCFQEVFGFKPNPSQEKLIDSINGPGLYILEASTGSGKTEAALFAAYKLMAEGHNNGLYFGLPTKLTSDRIHSRVQDFADKICETHIPVMLSHGSAWLNDDIMKIIMSGGNEMSPGGSWFCPSKRTLLAPFGVGTIDQALFAVMNVKHFFVRAFGLAGKVLILDEVHSYDVYTGTILDKLAEFAKKAGCSVIILSATLTKERKKAFLCSKLPDDNSYPLITSETKAVVRSCSSESPPEKNIGLSVVNPSESGKIAEHAVAKAESGQSILWICNTVAEAQNRFKSLKSLRKEDSFHIGLLHSRFTVEHRRNLEDNWMKRLGKSGNRSKGAILVATQVVEQSVDIDADFLITELAPSDMLIQRLGRLWRHSRNNRPSESPECIIISGNIGPAKNKEELINLLGKNNSKVYAPYVLWKTWTVWEKLKSIGIPSDIRNVLESTYLRNKIDEPGFINELYEEMMIEREKLRRKASAMLTGVSLPVADDDDDRATTRYSEIPAIDCLLVKKIFSVKRDEAEITLLSGEKLKVSSFQRNHLVSKLLHKNTFSVASYNFNGNGNSFKIPDYLKKHFYGRLAVLKIDNGTLYLDEEQTILRYTDELGVHKQDSISMESKKIMDYNKYESGEFDYELDNW